MTQDKFNEMMDEYIRQQGLRPADIWPNDEFNKAKRAGITDGTRPKAFATRQEVAVMVYRMVGK